MILWIIGFSPSADGKEGRLPADQAVMEHNASAWHPGTHEYELKIIHQYDDYGRRVRISEYNQGERLNYRKHFSYDKQGQLVLESTADSTGKVQERRAFSYDMDGNLTEQVNRNLEGDVLSRNIFLYDSVMNRTGWIYYGKNDDLEWQRRYIHDDQGRRTEEHWLDAKERLTYLYLYAYDDRNMIGQNVYDGKGRLQSRYLYEYNSDGRRIAVKWFDNNGVLRWIRTFRYDGRGHRVEERRYHAYRVLFSREWRYRLDHTFRYTHDEIGRTLSMTVYDGRGRYLYSMDQSFDNMGRLVYYSRTDAYDQEEMHYRIMYDGSGNRAAWIWYDKTGNEELRFVYEYDQAGRMVAEYRYE